jgi:hypothetical protein
MVLTMGAATTSRKLPAGLEGIGTRRRSEIPSLSNSLGYLFLRVKIPRFLITGFSCSIP